MSKDKIRFNFWISKEELDAIKKRAKKEKRSASNYIRSKSLLFQ